MIVTLTRLQRRADLRRASDGVLLHGGDAGDGNGGDARARHGELIKGNGAYAANIELPSGGTWSLTITASKGGNPIATKQVDVSASGSMAM